VIFGHDDQLSWEIGLTTGVAPQSKPIITVGGSEFSDTGYPVGTWAWTAVRYDGDATAADAADFEVEVFTNGLIDCQGTCGSTTSRPVGTTTSAVRIGAAHNNGARYMGDAYECFYFDEALTDEAMAELYLCGMDGLATAADREAAYTGATCASAPGANAGCCAP
jgi:hypothetical protein